MWGQQSTPLWRPPPSKGNANAGKGNGKAPAGGSRDLMRSRSRSQSRHHSRSRGRSASGGSSASSRPKQKRLKKSGGFDNMAKPFETQKPKPPPSAIPQRGLALAPGRKADVHSLKSAAQYNNCECRVLDGPNDKGRWEVEVDYQCEMKTLSLMAANLHPKPSCGWELVVAPVVTGVQDTEISQAFSPFGRVRSVNMTRDENGTFKNVCLVEMALREAAEAVMKELNGFILKGKAVKIDWSTMAKTEMGMLEKSRASRDDPADDGPTRSFRESNTFEIGQAVLVANLKSAPQFNGTIGIVVGVRSAERCDVELEEAPGMKKVLALKVENLSLANSAEKDASEASNPASSSTRHFTEATGSEAPTESRRRRASAWEAENSGGYVVDQPRTSTSAASVPSVPSSLGPEEPAPPLPSDEELTQLPVKELKRILTAHKVDITACLEKKDFLEKARELAQQVRESG